MDVPTIETIRTLRDEIRTLLPKIKASQHKEQRFGTENEYTAKGLISGLDGLLTDLSTLTRSPAQFVKKSTYTERNTIVSHLTQIKGGVVNKDFQVIAKYLDLLKITTSRFNIRHTEERQEELDKRIDELQRRINNLDVTCEIIDGTAKEVIEKEEAITKTELLLHEKLDALEELETELNTKLATLEEQRTGLDDLLDTDQERSNTIASLLADSKSHSEVIETFSKRVSQRENQLEDQEIKTNTYIKNLSNFTSEREELLEDASKLIQEARSALGYTTARGISAAFNKKYEDTLKDKTTELWLRYAAGFILLAGLVGVWIFIDRKVELEALFGRLSLIPIFIGGAWFAAAQYVKQKNISEDYAYKSVLAKAMVGFADQLEENSDKGDNYSHYIQSLFAEIHNDPLRKRGSHSVNKADIEKLLKEIKDLAHSAARSQD